MDENAPPFQQDLDVQNFQRQTQTGGKTAAVFKERTAATERIVGSCLVRRVGETEDLAPGRPRQESAVALGGAAQNSADLQPVGPPYHNPVAPAELAAPPGAEAAELG